MKKPIQLLSLFLMLTAGALVSGCGSLSSLFGDPWEGTWWGVQDAGTNWSGDHIRNLETFTFTKTDSGIAVEHKTQRGSKEIDGDLSGPATADGGRLTITPTSSGRPVTFTYSRTSKNIETSLKNADGTPVVLKELTPENNTEMEQIRSEIVQISKKPENQVNTTLAR